jgi:hypothetical protein
VLIGRRISHEVTSKLHGDSQAESSAQFAGITESSTFDPFSGASGQVIANLAQVPDPALYWNTMGLQCMTRFGNTRKSEDITLAAQLFQKAIISAAPDNPSRSEILNNWACSLMRRYESLEIINDLNFAVKAAEEAVSILPAGHPDKAMCLSNLGSCLGKRYEAS